jgi:hypothetical protein
MTRREVKGKNAATPTKGGIYQSFQTMFGHRPGQKKKGPVLAGAIRRFGVRPLL